MANQLPAPDFDGSRYERPNDQWVCGRQCDGQPCRMGPSASGECRATSECRPLLEKVAGQEKGHWKCTRPKEQGGPCADGPRPDGKCSRPIPPCSPVRSLRNLRGKVTIAFCALVLGWLLLAVTGRWRWQFVNPGPVSEPHRSGLFSQLATNRLHARSDCAGCHEAANGGVTTWSLTAMNARPAPWDWRQFSRAQPGPRPATAVDAQACAVCHDQHEFHQPSVTAVASCSACHVEHEGTRMAAPSDARCADCHNDGGVMAAASAHGQGMDSLRFDPPVAAGARPFRTPRPAGGRTNLFTSFWDGHPNFGVLAQGLADTNTLRFNHALHLGATVRLDGRGLNCADCHVPDATGAYFARVSFAQHCQSCHDLQFDPANPALKLPHGDVQAARAALRGLPLTYADLARRRGLIQRDAVGEFARTNLARMRQTFGSGEALERLVLFTPDPREFQRGISPERRAHYAGCAYCHAVNPGSADLAEIAPVTTPDRWLLAGRFHHAKHVQWNCEQCHAIRSSRVARDINLPAQASCVGCHSPKGGAPSNCATCHTYHLKNSR